MAKTFKIEPNSSYHRVLDVMSRSDSSWIRESKVRAELLVHPTTNFSDGPMFKLSQNGFSKVRRKDETQKRVREGMITPKGLMVLQFLNEGRAVDQNGQPINTPESKKIENFVLGQLKERVIHPWNDETFNLYLLSKGIDTRQELGQYGISPCLSLERFDLVEKTKNGRKSEYSMTEEGRNAFNILRRGSSYSTRNKCKANVAIKEELLSIMDHEWAVGDLLLKPGKDILCVNLVINRLLEIIDQNDCDDNELTQRLKRGPQLETIKLSIERLLKYRNTNIDRWRETIVEQLVLLFSNNNKKLQELKDDPEFGPNYEDVVNKVMIMRLSI